MDERPNRRRFRFAFSLRTLFVAVTVLIVGGIMLCDWLGGHWKLVRERQAILAEIENVTRGRGMQITAASIPATQLAQIEYWQISSVRRLLNDESYIHICVPTPLSEDPLFVERVSRAFPEAGITLWLPGVDKVRAPIVSPAIHPQNSPGPDFVPVTAINCELPMQPRVYFGR